MENKQLKLIEDRIHRSAEVKYAMANDFRLLETIEKVAQEIADIYRKRGKVLFCGNGGSAADAQHLAAELSGKFYIDRDPLFAEALHVNTSYLTAVANDYSFDIVYERLIKAKGTKGDALIGLSTSGNSVNIIKAIEMANQKEMVTIGLTGEGGGKMSNLCKYLIEVPSKDTPRIQESHILIGHILCEIVEKELFGND